ncbi:FAD:protein FMN transferase [Rubellimicrobium arenae]|uniref:FAD:protein FMN transferase n=1 Tax=Rubellimicrobium arenae TaxID=2817372 RepID=UPI001B3128B3|nr:FAD:protein FMN transferase [Rubellimicrobium arenae]
MARISRRRFLAFSAALPLAGRAAAAELPVQRFQGTALGAGASLLLAHPEAARIAARVWAEVDRLEDVFSLYRPDSALSRLNAAGVVEAPPFDLLDGLSLAGAVHTATQGAFDPTVQPLWTEYAAAMTEGRPPDPDAVRDLVGWTGVTIEPGRIALARPGMALTLNGIAQGYIADRVAALLAAEGLTDILIDTGELRALGGDPRGGDWPVQIVEGPAVPLRDRALATSAPLGTTFDQAGRIGHILDPRSGRPAAAGWRQVSVTAPSAALADACSTAFCLMGREAITETLTRLPGLRVVSLL